MADVGQWSGGVIGSLQPGTTWGAPNGLFPTEDLNPGSVYSFASSTSTLTLPSSDLAKGYLVKAFFEFEDSSNGRHNPQGRFIQSGGTGDFISAQAGGYNRDNSEDRSYVLVWAFVHNPSASATIQFQWKRDSDAPGASDGTVRSCFQVIPLNYKEAVIASSTSTATYGGTTPNQVTGFSADLETDSASIELVSNVITMKTDNRYYMCFGGYFMEDHSGGTRTQRWAGFEIDGSFEDAAKSYAMYRNAANDQNGCVFTWLINRATTNITLEMNAYRGDGVAAGQGGADSDGTGTETNGHQVMVVLELYEDAEAFRAQDDDSDQDITNTSPVDLTIFEVANIAFNDGTAFTRASDTAMNCEKAMDVLIGMNCGIASEVVADGSRLTEHGAPTINGTEQTLHGHGNYGRGNQTSADALGLAVNLLAALAVALNDDIGASVQTLSGSEAAADNWRTQPGWVGMWGLNLDSLDPPAPSAEKHGRFLKAPTIVKPRMPAF